jgi:phosphatidylglycerol:prolipoprotein diacylglycerol transferase
MYPEICKIGPFTVYAYGLMLAVAFLTGSALAVMQAKREKINSDIILNMAFNVFISGVVGARAFYIFENFGYYVNNPVEIVMLQHGGLSWFGGLIFGFFSGIAYLKKKKLPIYKVLDLIVPFVALGQAIGRIGCLLNGCCFGKISEYGIYFPVHKLILIPTQLYSSLILIAIFIYLRSLQDKPHKEGTIFFTYLLLYSIKRFFIEFLRSDNEILLFGLTLFQVISIAICCISAFSLFLIKKNEK